MKGITGFIVAVIIVACIFILITQMGTIGIAQVNRIALDTVETLKPGGLVHFKENETDDGKSKYCMVKYESWTGSGYRIPANGSWGKMGPIPTDKPCIPAVGGREYYPKIGSAEAGKKVWFQACFIRLVNESLVETGNYIEADPKCDPDFWPEEKEIPNPVLLANCELRIATGTTFQISMCKEFGFSHSNGLRRNPGPEMIKAGATSFIVWYGFQGTTVYPVYNLNDPLFNFRPKSLGPTTITIQKKIE